MEEDSREDIPGSIVFPEDLLREVRVPKHQPGAYTDAEKKAIFLKYCRAEGLRFASDVQNIGHQKELLIRDKGLRPVAEVTSFAGVEEVVINKGVDILVGRSDRRAVETLFANFAHGLAVVVLNDINGRPRTIQPGKDEMPEIESRRNNTYRTLWEGIARRG